MSNKQSTLFPENDAAVLPELPLETAARLAFQIKTTVEGHCDLIEIAGSIRRQKPKVHDIDFVVVTKNDLEWQKMKAKPSCSGSSVIKAFLPCQNGLFQIDFYRAKPSTFGVLLLIRTGSADHNMWLAGYSISKGMRLKYSEGLLKDGTVIAGDQENAVFETLGLPCPTATEREISEGKPVWLPKQ
jgi:DNA polymerase/3'-5' exonuclease PolX